MLAITILLVIATSAVLTQLVWLFMTEIAAGPEDEARTTKPEAPYQGNRCSHVAPVSPLFHATGVPFPGIPSGIEYAAEELARRNRAAQLNHALRGYEDQVAPALAAERVS